MNKKSFKNQKGQALIPVLVVLLIVLVLGVGMLYLIVGGALISSHSMKGEKIILAAEGALENGLLKILRNPSYIGESLQVNGVDCTIEISGSAPIIIQAKCDDGRAVRRYQAEVSFIQGEMLVDNYQEIE